MPIYRVHARLREDRAAELRHALTSGSIEVMKPEGHEIHRALTSARVADDGVVAWGERCYCGTPLAHERSSVLDRYFSDIATVVVPQMFHPTEGRPLPEVLNALAEAE